MVLQKHECTGISNLESCLCSENRACASLECFKGGTGPCALHTCQPKPSTTWGDAAHREIWLENDQQQHDAPFRQKKLSADFLHSPEQP